MSAPWGNPPPPDRRGYADFIGRPVLTIVGGVRRDVPSQYGIRDLPHVTIVSLVGPDAGTVYPDIIVFTQRVAGRLKGCEPGQVILSKVVDKGKAPDLDDPDQWDQQVGTAWYNANPGKVERLPAMGELQIGAINDFRAFLAKPQQGQPAQQSYAQPQYAPPQYAQQMQPQYQYGPDRDHGQGSMGYPPAVAQPQYQQPAQQGNGGQQYQPSPEHQQSLRPPTSDGPPAAPPPQTYMTQAPAAAPSNPTLDSMRAPAVPAESQFTEPPF